MIIARHARVAQSVTVVTVNARIFLAMENSEPKAELVKRFKEFRKQSTLDSADPANADDEMISIARSVRRKRGSWWQVPKDMPDQKDDD